MTVADGMGKHAREIHTKVTHTWPFARHGLAQLAVVVAAARVHLAGAGQHQRVHPAAGDVIDVAAARPVQMQRRADLPMGACRYYV